MLTNLLTVERIRNMLIYDEGGFRGSSLDVLVIEHLDTVRQLQRLSVFQQEVVIAVAEGWSVSEMARAFEISSYMVKKRIESIRNELYPDGYDINDVYAGVI